MLILATRWWRLLRSDGSGDGGQSFRPRLRDRIRIWWSQTVTMFDGDTDGGDRPVPHTKVTAGAIPAHAMNIALSVGVAVSLGLAMIRVLTGISIMWFLLPGYALSLALSFVVPKIFTSIAFDSGGVASGPMTATFLLPFAMGACDAEGGNVVTDAFGVVAMVAMTPLVTIQLLGESYKRRIKHVAPAAVAQVEEIIELA